MATISLAEVAANRRTIEVDLGLPPAEDGSPQTLTVTYRVNTITPEDELRFQLMDDKSTVPQERRDEFLAFFVRLVASWGLTGPLTAPNGKEAVPAGKPVALKPDVLGVVPSPVLLAVLRSCMEDTAADPKAPRPMAANGSKTAA